MWPSLTRPGGALIRTLEGHGAGVNAVALSGDGRLAVSGSDDKTLKVWDVATGTCIATFTADAPLTCVALQGAGVFAGDNLGHVHLFALKISDERAPSASDRSPA